jgi:hypothetical protein
MPIKPFACAYGDTFGIEATHLAGEVDISTAPGEVTTLRMDDVRALAAWLNQVADAEEAEAAETAAFFAARQTQSAA